MKHVIFIIWLTFIQSADLFAQSIDASPCSRYFEITNKLRKGDTLSRDTWNTFLQDKAIQTYMADQGVDQSYYEAYRKNMQIVYMPQKDSILQRRLKDSLNYWLTYTIYQYKKHEDGMKAYLQRITANPQAYFNVLYKYAYTALPKRAHKTLPNYVFTIIPIHNDAHAQDGWIIYTLLCAYFNDSNRLGALGGHELHHALRPVPNLKPEHRDETAMRIMYAIMNEGTADMVDKKYTTDTAKTLPFFQRYFEEFYNDAKPVMPHLDSMLQLNAKTDTVIKFRNYLKGTSYTSGHVPGTYMAYYIEKNGLKAKLLKQIEDPYYFFMVYNEAARKDKSKPYVFSKETMDYIESLHKKYMKQAKYK